MKALIMVIISSLIFPSLFIWAREVDENTALLFTFDEPFKEFVEDVSPNGNDGKVGVGVDWSDKGKIGGCAKFTGKDGITVDSSRSLEKIEGNITVEFWMKKEEEIPLGESRIVIDRGWEGVGSYRIDLSKDAEKDKITINWRVQGAAGSAQLQGFPLANEWHYITGTYDGKMIMLYIDGKLRGARAAAKLVIQNDFDLKIGSDFVGLLDEVRISDVVRDSSEMKAHMEGKGKAVNPNLNLSTTWGLLKSQSTE